jgi:hypothetical protein
VVVGIILFMGMNTLRQKFKLLDNLSMLDIEDIRGIKEMRLIISRFTIAVDKLEKLSLAHEVSSAKFKLEIDNVKESLIRLEMRIKTLEDKVHES